MSEGFEVPPEVVLLPEKGAEVIDRRRVWKLAREYGREGDWVVIEARSNPKVYGYSCFEKLMNGTMRGFGILGFEEGSPTVRFSNQVDMFLPGYIHTRPVGDNQAMEYLSLRIIRVYNPEANPKKATDEAQEDTSSVDSSDCWQVVGVMVNACSELIEMKLE